MGNLRFITSELLELLVFLSTKAFEKSSDEVAKEILKQKKSFKKTPERNSWKLLSLQDYTAQHQSEVQCFI